MKAGLRMRDGGREEERERKTEIDKVREREGTYGTVLHQALTVPLL
jgi:hypothetical protein